MKAEVWKNFPSELHAHVLQFCSVPEICRLRIVCREWNDLTHKLEFAIRARPQHTYILRAPHEIDISNVTSPNNIHTNEEITGLLLQESFDLFDPSTQKSCPINLEYLYNGIPLSPFDGFQIMAADKGFVWVLWNKSSGYMQVTNPVTRSVLEIPPIRREDTRLAYATGMMTVAEDYSSFALYFVFAIGVLERPSLVWFDSQVGEWREFSRLPHGSSPSHMLKFNGALYMLIWDWEEDVHRILSLDMVRDAWIDTGVMLFYHVIAPQLTTTLKRLFFVGVDESDYENICIKVVEIDVVSGDDWEVTPPIGNQCDEELWESLNYFMGNRSRAYTDLQGIGGNMVAVGCGNFIVLTSITGKSIAYDLLKDDWSVWSSARRITNSLNHRNKLRHGLFGMTMTLTLNPIPMPRVQQ